MGRIIKNIKFSLINLILYRNPRSLPKDLESNIKDIYNSRDENRLENMKSIVTKSVLNSLGLDVSNASRNELPISIYLTKAQKSVIYTVNRQGHRVKLLNY